MADSHFACIVIWREGEDGREFMVIEYDSGDGVQIKFPGGTNNDRPGEDLDETLHREVRKETGLVFPTPPTKIWSGDKIPDRTNGGFHQKHAFIIEYGMVAGEMRTQPMIEDGKDRLSPPFWKTASELLVDPKRGASSTLTGPLLRPLRNIFPERLFFLAIFW